MKLPVQLSLEVPGTGSAESGDLKLEVVGSNKWFVASESFSLFH